MPAPSYAGRQPAPARRAGSRRGRLALASLSARGTGDRDWAGVTSRSASALRHDPEQSYDWSFNLGQPTSEGGRFRLLRHHARGGHRRRLSWPWIPSCIARSRSSRSSPQHADDPTSRARFLIEAEVTGRLEHPGIVPVYGLGQQRPGPAVLRHAVRPRPRASRRPSTAFTRPTAKPGRDPAERALALRQLLRRFIDVCHAIAYAHSRGVIHRDLKPANILLGPYGETLVVDWGLAKVVGRDDPTPRAGWPR